jgi:hypothetical protein
MFSIRIRSPLAVLVVRRSSRYCRSRVSVRAAALTSWAFLKAPFYPILLPVVEDLARIRYYDAISAGTTSPRPTRDWILNCPTGPADRLAQRRPAPGIPACRPWPRHRSHCHIRQWRQLLSARLEVMMVHEHT